jgi:hypothetical protein
MFQAISWKEYWLMMGVSLVIYYGWWIVKYGGSLGWRWMKAKVQPSGGRLATLIVEPVSEKTKAEDATTKAVTRSEETRSKEAGSAPEGSISEPGPEGSGLSAETDGAGPGSEAGPQLFLPMLAGELMKKVTALVERALAEKMGEAEIQDGLRGLLGEAPYCRLRGTAFREKVTEDIVRVMKSLGSMEIDVGVVSGLWDG